jgi:hypothetical protein
MAIFMERLAWAGRKSHGTVFSLKVRLEQAAEKLIFAHGVSRTG